MSKHDPDGKTSRCSPAAVKINFVQGPKALTQTWNELKHANLHKTANVHDVCRKDGQHLLSSDSQVTVCESSMLVAQLLRKLIRRIWASGQGV